MFHRYFYKLRSHQGGRSKLLGFKNEKLKAPFSLFFLRSVTVCYVMITTRVMLRNLSRASSIGSLTSYDGNWNENVTLKLNFALSVLRLFDVGALSLPWHE